VYNVIALVPENTYTYVWYGVVSWSLHFPISLTDEVSRLISCIGVPNWKSWKDNKTNC